MIVRPSLVIDDAHHGGSDDRAWATSIAHTPHLAAQLQQDTRAAGFDPLPVACVGGAVGATPRTISIAPPKVLS